MDTLLDFGFYRGQTVAQIVGKDISYVFWCIRDVDHFYVSQETLSEINKERRGFRLSSGKRVETEARLAFKEKLLRSQVESEAVARGMNNGSDEYSDAVTKARWYDDLGEDEIETAYWNLD
ncbi:MAG TPA: hypothetical protein VG737_14980 [Cyclobacteriaceae bacterium]|nr:hypothetical protein [Cyclobacteriaceae bacterium]